MGTKLHTNRIVIDINYEEIVRKYEIYCITTSDKYIKYGAHILDIPIDEISVKSICFESGKSLFVLADSGNNTFSAIKNYIDSLRDKDKYVVTKIAPCSVDEHILVQLFLNSLNNAENELLRFNNLTGKLFCYNPAWLIKGKSKQGDIIKQIVALQVSVDRHKYLRLDVKTFTSGILKKFMTFDKMQFSDYPQYTFGENLALRRVLKSESLSLEKKYIMRQIDGQKSHIPFMDISDYETLIKSKVGVLAKILDLFESRYSKYIALRFEDVESVAYSILSSEQQSFTKSSLKGTVVANGIHIIDCVKDTTSADLIEDIKGQILKSVDTDISVGSRLSKSKLNIKLIHNKDYYAGMKDEYEIREGYAIQHITVENGNISVSASIDNILKELVIKNDLVNKHISLSDWSKYGYNNDWLFGVSFNGVHWYMSIHPDGSFDFKRVELNLFEFDEYTKYNKYFEEEVRGIIVSPTGEINIIKDTSMFMMPEIKEIYNKYKAVYAYREFSSSAVITCLDSIDCDKLDEKARAEYDSLNNYLSTHETITNKMILTLVKSRKLRSHINRCVDEKTGLPLQVYMRNHEARERYLSSVIDINMFGKNDLTKYYCVGVQGKGMDSKLDHAMNVRKVYAGDNSKVFFHDLLPLMSVSFVRNGQLTVIPFPFKYLREYIKQVCDTDVDI